MKTNDSSSPLGHSPKSSSSGYSSGSQTSLLRERIEESVQQDNDNRDVEGSSLGYNSVLQHNVSTEYRPLQSLDPIIQGCNDNGACVDAFMERIALSQNDKDIMMSRTVFNTCVPIIVTTNESMKPKKVHKYSARDFHKALSKYPNCKSHTNEKGYNLLVLVILEGRIDFLEALFYCGILFDMLDVKVTKADNRYEGLTAKDIISKFNLKKIDAQLQIFTKLENSMTKLHKIARTGNAKAVQFLLDKHPQMMETPASDGSNCLMWAVTSGNLEVVKMIVAAGGEHKKKTFSDETLLGRATHLGYPDIISYLVKELSFNPDEKCKGESTPVHIAIENADLYVLQVLVQCYATITHEVLPKAARTGRVDIWRYVYQNIKDADIDWTDDNGRNSLYIAVENGFVDIARDIIQKNGCLMQKDRIQRNVLFAAIDSRDINMFRFIVKKLKSKGLLQRLLNEHDLYCGKERLFTVTGRDNGILGYHFIEVHRIYLDIFAKRIHEGGQLDIAKYGEIKKSGWGTPTTEDREDINTCYDISSMDLYRSPDMTPLHYAILYKQNDMAKTLIMEGADVNEKDCFGNQPLHIAAMRGDMSVINALEDRNVNSEFPGDLGMTPQCVAEANRHYHISDYFDGYRFLKDYDQELKDFIEQTKRELMELETEYLHKQRRRGRNIRQFIIGKCRDVHHGVNSLLFRMGTTQIQQASG